MLRSAPPRTLLDPQSLPNPIITGATLRDCQVMGEQGSVRWLRCLVSMEADKAYCIVRTLRDCIFGVVRHAVTLESRDGFYRYRLDQQVAIKCMNKAVILQQRGRIRENPISELSAMQLLSDPGHLHVQRLLECVQDDDTIYAICPYYPGGELFNFLEGRGSGLPEDQARDLFVQIVSGVHYMQSKRLCHRDMSLENILLDKHNDCVIIDMGMCLWLPEVDSTTQARVLVRKQGQCGKLTYMAPEIYSNEDFDGFAVDVWACGIILFILLAGVPPIEVPSIADPRYNMIATNRLNELLDIWQLQLSNQVRDLLGRLLKTEPADRLTVAQVLMHPWITCE